MEDLQLFLNASEKVPDSWIFTSLENISDIISGQHILKDDYNLYPQGLPYLTGPADFGSMYPIISKWTTKPKAISIKNDILITVKGAGVGKANLLNIEEAAISRQLMAVRPLQVDPNYLFSFVQFNFHSLQKLGAGSTVPGIDRGSILNIPLPLPPLPEQRRIVAKIEELFTQLDAGVSALEKAQAQLKRYRQSVLKAAVEGKLTEEWRRDHPEEEPASVLLERIERKREKSGKGRGKKLQPLDVSELPELPDGWTWATPDQLAANEKYSLAIGPFGSNLKVSDYREKGVPLVFVRNIRSGIFDGADTHYVTTEKAEELNAHKIAGGDVLITKMGEPPGDACLYPESRPTAIITADCIKWTLSNVLPERRFFVHVMNSHIMKGQILRITQGVAQKKVSLARFKGVLVPLPPLAEQQEIVSEIERRLSLADQTEVTLEANLRRAARLRQSILRKAFRGDLVPQDPNDEPASALLERIRAEMAAGRPAKDQGRVKRGRGRPRKSAAAQTELI